MRKIHTDKAPTPVGPYSQAFASNRFVFCAGQIGIDPATGELIGSDIKSQTHQTIKNIEAVLLKAESSLGKVVKTTCYLTDMDNYKTFNEIYATYFTTNPPRATIEVTKLPKNALIEIEVIAEQNLQ